MNLPNCIISILNELTSHGFEAWVVGGAVRDSLLKKEPHDWDITTNALPQEIKLIFKKTIDIGIKHGTICVVSDFLVDVTTYRTDGEYLDSRHPTSVNFVSNLKDDLARRDLTINALAYNEKIVDYFGGMDDLEKGIIRAVGEPIKRFEEDALRILRAARFSAQLDFDIEPITKAAMKKTAHLLCNISEERVRDELLLILCGQNPKRVEILLECDILKYILPELEACFGVGQNNHHHIYDVGTHIFKTVEAAPKELRLMALLHDIGKPIAKKTELGIDHFKKHEIYSLELAEKILHRLRFDNKTITKTLRLIKWHDYRMEPNAKAVRRAIAKIGDDIFLDLLSFQKADCLAQNPELLEQKLERIRLIEKLYEQERDKPLTIAQLFIDGDDLIKLGITGISLGNALRHLLDIVIENPNLNNKEKLIMEALKWKKSNAE